MLVFVLLAIHFSLFFYVGYVGVKEVAKGCIKHLCYTSITFFYSLSFFRGTFSYPPYTESIYKHLCLCLICLPSSFLCLFIVGV